DPHIRSPRFITEGLQERAAQRLRIACWDNANQTRKPALARKVRPPRSISADNRQATSESLAQHHTEPVLTGRERTHMDGRIKALKVPLGNRIIMNEPRMSWKGNVSHGPNVHQLYIIESQERLHEEIGAFLKGPGTDEEHGGLGRPGTCPNRELLQVD